VRDSSPKIENLTLWMGSPPSRSSVWKENHTDRMVLKRITLLLFWTGESNATPVFITTKLTLLITHGRWSGKGSPNLQKLTSQSHIIMDCKSKRLTQISYNSYQLKENTWHHVKYYKHKTINPSISVLTWWIFSLCITIKFYNKIINLLVSWISSSA